MSNRTKLLAARNEMSGLAFGLDDVSRAVSVEAGRVRLQRARHLLLMATAEITEAMALPVDPIVEHGAC